MQCQAMAQCFPDAGKPDSGSILLLMLEQCRYKKAQAGRMAMQVLYADNWWAVATGVLIFALLAYWQFNQKPWVHAASIAAMDLGLYVSPGSFTWSGAGVVSCGL